MFFKRITSVFSIFGLMFGLLSACSFLPTSGPYSHSVNNNASVVLDSSSLEAEEEVPFRYALVELSRGMSSLFDQKNALLSAVDAASWPETGYPQNLKISVGDAITVTIYEAKSGGLFVPEEAGARPGNFVTLPSQIIDRSGSITVPYVGAVKAAGRTPAEISETLAERLREYAIEPQVVVSFAQRNGSEVSVIGQVNDARRFPLNFQGDKVLDAIAQAGGLDIPGYEAHVTLQRRGEEYTIPFDLLLLDPKTNIFLKPQDTIYLYREPQTYVVYGAADFRGSFPFGKRDLSLSEALGQSGGLNDERADPSEVYIYRHERRERFEALQALGQDSVVFEVNGQDLPVIYKINFREPDGFFLAQKFAVQDGDIIYVANAESVEFSKFLDILNLNAVMTENSDRAYFD